MRRPIISRYAPHRGTVSNLAWITLLGLAVALYAWWPMIEAYPKTPEGDGRYFLHLMSVVKVSIRRYGELPLWNPYECGGAPLWDNPESLAASPILFATTFLSATKTVWVWNITHLVGGFVSMWLLARMELRVGRLAAFYAASLFTCAMSNASQYAGAHSALMSFMWAPLALLLWRRAEDSLGYAAGLGLLFALFFYDGATYPIPHTALMLSIETLTRAQPRRIPKLLRAGLVAMSVAFLVGAPRILPLLDQFGSKHRLIEPDHDHLARWNTLVAMYTSREIHWWVKLPGQEYVWGEYGAYVGAVGIGLAVVGMIFAAREARWALFVAIAVFVLMLGHFATFAPWSLLQGHVFPFKSMRVPARFRLLLQLFIAGFGALTIDRLPKLVRALGRPSWTDATMAALIGVAFINVGDVARASSALVADRFGGQPEQFRPVAAQLYYEGDHLPEYASQPAQNRATLHCRDAWAFFHGAPVWTGDVPPAEARDGNATILSARRTQNTFTIDVDAAQPARIFVNSNFERGFRTDIGTIVEDNKQLAIDIPAGHHTIHVAYWPKGLTAGLWLFGLSMVTALIYLSILVRKRFYARAHRSEMERAS